VIIMEGTDGVCQRTFDRVLTTREERFFEESNKLSSCSTDIGQILTISSSDFESHQQ